MKRFVFIVVLVFLFTSNLVAAGCEKDTDCKGDRICVKGECIFPSEYRNEAVKDSESFEDQYAQIDVLELEEFIKVHRTGRILGIVGVLICFPIAVGGFLAGGMFYKMGTDWKNYYISSFAIGGATLIIGVIAAIRLSYHIGKIDEYEFQLNIKKNPSMIKTKAFSMDYPVPIVQRIGEHNVYGAELIFRF